MQIIFLSLLVLQLVAFAQQRIACIEPGRILSESQLVKDREGQLRSKAEDYQKQLDQISKRLEDLKRQIESRAITQSVREQRIREYQRLESEGMELQQRAQREIGELKGRLEEEITSRVKNIAQDLARSRGLSAVLDCTVFVYFSPDMDLTREVIQRLDQQR